MRMRIPEILVLKPSGCFPAQRCTALAVLLICAALVGCSTQSIGSYRQVYTLAPLQLPDRLVTLEQASAVPTPELLTIDDDMRAFVARYVGDISYPRQRLEMLHSAISGSATLGVDYQQFAGGTAADVFHRGTANCLSYASLFVAMAREAGLDAQYQWLEVRPQWTRQGERVMVRLHVNVAVKMRGKAQFMVDIDPLESRDIASSQLIRDRDAQALHHSNIAMEALAINDLETAWLNAVRALQLSPDIAHLWVNLGAIYRMADQHRDAEGAYLQALRLDSWDRSAMNNLAVLYGIEGRTEEQSHWAGKVNRYRESNPYYHAWLGDKAGETDDWRQAAQYYEKAVSMRPDDSSLLYALGVIHTKLGEVALATEYLEKAIDSAVLYSDKKTYQQQLNMLRSGAQIGS